MTYFETVETSGDETLHRWSLKITLSWTLVSLSQYLCTLPSKTVFV